MKSSKLVDYPDRAKAKSIIITTENLVFSGYPVITKVPQKAVNPSFKSEVDLDSLEVFKINFRKGRTGEDLTKDEARLLKEYNSGQKSLEFRFGTYKRY